MSYRLLIFKVFKVSVHRKPTRGRTTETFSDKTLIVPLRIGGHFCNQQSEALMNRLPVVMMLERI